MWNIHGVGSIPLGINHTSISVTLMMESLKQRGVTMTLTCLLVCREEIQRIKAGNPDITHREAFSAAAKNVRSNTIHHTPTSLIHLFLEFPFLV